MRQPTTSVILSTYNQPDCLEKTLRGFAVQDRCDFEVVVADDGSRDETRERLWHLRPQLPFELVHVWQPDSGFRKSSALNKAIARSRGDYLIFTDGDCIPRRNFISQHLRLREPGHFLSGGYFKLPMTISTAINRDDIASNACFDVAWLRAHGLPAAPRNVRLSARGSTARILDAIIQTRPSWNGHNASGWRLDVLMANGFDERMGYGGADCELGMRLENAGLRCKHIGHKVIVLHLDHPCAHRTGETVARNADIRKQTLVSRIVWTPHGITKRPRQV